MYVVREYSRKTHVQFIIRDWISTKPLWPLTDKIKQLVSAIVSKEQLTNRLHIL
jgi:hypothetical protein